MIYLGQVKNGVVILEDQASLPDGTKVKIEPVEAAESAAQEEMPTLYERFKDVIGIVDGLPPDFAQNHDHYIHGTPKR